MEKEKIKKQIRKFFRRTFEHSTRKELIELLLDYIEKRDCQECFFFKKFLEKK